MTERHQTREIKIGNICIGGQNPIAVQSMLNVRPEDVSGNVKQAMALEKAGCQILRVAIPHPKDVRLIEAIKKEITIPLVADIHFDYRIALECAAAGVDKIRINPGNIGDRDRVKQVANACKAKNIPIRIGVNSGSLEKRALEKYQALVPEVFVESAKYHCGLLEAEDFDQIVVALKSSSVETTIRSYRLAAQELSYPLHLGVTEAGTKQMGIVKSAIGIGSLLVDGIGDTLRVTLTADPLEEIAPAYDILRASGRLQKGVNLISCPTCGRTKIDLIPLAQRVEKALLQVDKNITVAVMGCAVNGPGEAKSADIGIAAGDGNGIIFRHGEIIEQVPEEQMLERLLYHIDRI